MAPQKVYTIGVSNKFAGLGYESSSDEEDGTRKPSNASKEKKQKSQKGNTNAPNTGTGISNNLPHPSHGQNSSKENRSPDGRLAGQHQSSSNRNPRVYGNNFHNDSTRGSPHENSDRSFRGRRGGGLNGGGARGFRGGRGGFGFAENDTYRQQDSNDSYDLNGSGEMVNGVQNHPVSPFKTSRGVRGGGFRGHDGRPFRNRRDFGRHSNTGRGAELKKDGGGGHNWGNELDFGNQSIEKSASNSDEMIILDEDEKKEGDENDDATRDPEVLNAEEEPPSPVEPETLDFDAYKAEQAAKRANLPQSSNDAKPTVRITTVKDLESQGYTKHVKKSEDEEESEEETSDDESDSDDEEEEEEEDDRRKKTMNVYEYIYNEGGRVRLFPGRRGGRGGGLGSGEKRRMERGGYRSRNWRGKDAPDIQDERAFPKLG